ncbi:hypothetical protein [Azospirillum sp. TSO5]|uniref:hypothetical protein n=1 Tax=Azospirillum sp. TSO5 TaxID=716760 RepID=UPI0018EE732E|nr:hypothetical protein [Azospirillum sp. TSO5]
MDATFMEWLGYATLYAIVVKAVLASTPTPPPETAIGKVYRALEWSVLVIGRVKENAGR